MPRSGQRGEKELAFPIQLRDCNALAREGEIRERGHLHDEDVKPAA